jgi:O-antigen ligase
MRRSTLPYLFCLTLALGYAVLKLGAVKSADRNISLLLLGLTALAYRLFTSRSNLAPALGSALQWSLILLPAYVALQLVPLPLSFLKLVSPARAGVLEALVPLFPRLGFAPLSVYPAATVGHFCRVAGYIVIFLLVREIAWRNFHRPWTFILPLMLLASLEACLGLVQFALGESGSPAHGTYVNRNHFAGLLEMVLPFAVMYSIMPLLQARAQWQSALLPVLKACAGLTLSAVIFLGVIYSLSRMGFVASLSSLFLVGTLALSRGAGAWKKWLAAGLVAALVVLTFVFLPPDQLIMRFADLGSTEKVTAQDRLQMWQETLPLIRDYGLLGCGLGGYESAFLKYNVTSHNSTVDYAHNDYLQLLADLGLIGFSMIALMMGTLLVKATRVAWRSAKMNSRCVALACVGSLAAILIHSLVDFNLYIPANAMALAWISGIVTGLEFYG